MPSLNIGNKELTIKINTMNFYVGQEVVCIKKHIQNAVQVGKHYFINAIKRDCCGYIVVDVGITEDWLKDAPKYVRCAEGRHTVLNDGIWWIGIEKFAPLESIPASHEIAVKKLIEEYQTILN